MPSEASQFRIIVGQVYVRYMCTYVLHHAHARLSKLAGFARHKKKLWKRKEQPQNDSLSMLPQNTL